MQIHSLKNLGTNDITDNPLLFHMETLEPQFISRGLSTSTPSITQIGSILDFFQSTFHLHEFVCML